jgi:hypothetical protein
MPKLTKVVVYHDDYPGDPRKDMDLMCEIAEVDRYQWWRGSLSRSEKLRELVTQTKGWKVAEDFAAAADTDAPDLDDDTILNKWVELLADTELKTLEFWTGNHNYHFLAYTTPELCEKLGAKWENAEAAMKGEVEVFTKWAEGDTWGVRVLEAEIEEGQDADDLDDDDWDEIDDAWGFYGLDKDNGMRDLLASELWPLLDEAMRNPCYA